MKLQQLVAGDSLDFYDEFDTYPASDGWTLKYRLTPRFTSPAQTPIVITASTFDTTQYRVQQSPATTAAWTAGIYTWTRWVEKAGARQSLGAGELEVLADPANLAAGYDQRGHARKVLDAIEAVIERRATRDQEEYAIDGRSLKRTPIDDLYRLRQRYAAEVAGEDAMLNLAAGTPGRKIQVRL